MKIIHPRHLLLAATLPCAILLATPLAHAKDVENTSTVKFSDPAKPGTVRIAVQTGDITITGTDRTDVSVHTDLQPHDAAPRKDGLRVLSETATYTLVEKDNVVTLDTDRDFWASAGHNSGFRVEVPHNTNVIVSNGLGGEVHISDLSGDIEVKTLNSEINLNNISGSALVETINGEITANVAKLQADKPLSFTSMNGEIDIHVPEDAQAHVRLRTQNGAILTDFGDKALVTKTEAMPGGRNAHRVTINALDDSEIKVAVREAVRVGMEAAREAAEAMREAASAAREAAAEARAEAAEQAGHVQPAKAPRAPVVPVPPVPPMTGGKLVSGSLNGGGGPEIYAAAMNGNITLRKGK